MNAEEAFRYIGGALQLVGVIAIILGIDDARSYLRGETPFLERRWTAFKAWVRRARRRLSRKPPASAQARTIFPAFESSGAMKITPRLGLKGLDTAAALAELESRIETLQQHVDKRSRELRSHIDQTNVTLTTEIEASVSRLRSELHTLTVGGSGWQLRGALLFLVGIAFQTFDGQLADLVRYMLTDLRPSWRLI